MKKVPIYILLLLYSAVQLKPLTVVLQDAFAHTFNKMQHMATVHYENGRYHVHKDLQAIHEQNNASKTGQKPGSEKSTEQFSPQNIQELNFSLSPATTEVALVFNPVKDLLAGFTQINSPPPKS